MPKGKYLRSKEYREKMSKACKGKKMSPEAIEKTASFHRGRKRSPETCAKIALAAKNRSESWRQKQSLAAKNRSESWRQKQSLAKKGKKLSKETKEKIGRASKGRICSEETKTKLSISKIGQRNPMYGKKGPLHHNWTGGYNVELYGLSFTTELRRSVRKRDKNTCQLCDVPRIECTRAMCVHHIDYDKTNNDPVNLISLCCSCHCRTNTNRNYWVNFFQDLMLEKSPFLN